MCQYGVEAVQPYREQNAVYVLTLLSGPNMPKPISSSTSKDVKRPLGSQIEAGVTQCQNN